tara:strand:- start:360 stop:1079 length:720 start_codon:yes stop_codon:yes gene_type:complete
MKKIPKHIAIIMDGNGRWAKSNNKPRIFGHKSGIRRVKEIVQYSINNDIEILSLYTFSSENWSRPKLEIKGLMRLIILTVDDYINKLMDNNVQVRILGDTSKLPLKVANKLNEAVDITSKNDKLTLNLAINYGSKEEILRAVKLISKDLMNNNINFDDIDAKLLESKLYTHSQPDPDLLIRTGGESRLSNFLLWQLAYSEIVINDKYWPDYSAEDLSDDIQEYMKRERRFGKISEQIIG